MKIIYNRFIPFGRNFLAINLFGVLFAKGPCDSVTINHEEIHTRQMRELLYLPFYVAYVVGWLFRLAQYRDFMKAYANQRDIGYLRRRRPYSFLKYL